MENKTITNNTEHNDDIETRKVSSQHIKDFRKNVIKCSQAILAERIDVDTQTIGRYERMESSVSNSSAEALAQLSGYIKEYWLGLTECKTDDEFIEECANAAATEQHQKEIYQSRKRERIKTLFEICGFGYEDLSGSRYDFIEFSNDEAAIAEHQHAMENHTPNKITDYSQKFFTAPVYLSNDDLAELSRNISGLIGYTCYKKTIISQ